MAIIAGINSAVTTTGAREDLSDTITTISPEETPLYTNANKKSATGINHEWQTDTLAASTSANAVVEGGSVTVSTAAQTTRLGNILQISQKTYGVSNTLRALNLAGRSDELLRLRVKKGLELRRDVEVILHTNQAKVAASGDSTARLLAGLPAWIPKTNVTGVSSAVSASPTTGDGSSAVAAFTGSTAITYELVSSANQLAYVAGGEVDLIELAPSLKRAWSLLAFGSAPSTAQIRYNVDREGKPMAVGTVEKWMSDFGTVDVMPNRQFAIQSSTFLKQAAFGLTTKHLSVASLRGFEVMKKGITGDGVEEFIVCEYTLENRAPDSHFGVYGVT